MDRNILLKERLASIPGAISEMDLTLEERLNTIDERVATLEKMCYGRSSEKLKGVS